MIRKLLLRGLLLVLVVGVVLFVLNRRFIIGLWQYGGQAREGSLNVGDAAPDVMLWPVDGSATVSLLAHLHGKPLVLVFGSFT